MALMYDMETVNTAMQEAIALVSGPGVRLTSRERLVLNTFASMKPVQAVQVIRCKECKHRGEYMFCPMVFQEWYHDDDGEEGTGFYLDDNARDDGFCHMGARMDEEEVEE